jgi:HSP20 family protein
MTESKVPLTRGKSGSSPSLSQQARQPFESLRQEVDRLFDEFGFSSWQPFGRRGISPAVDVVEGDKAYEVTAELPGMDEKDIEIKVTQDSLAIKGVKEEQKEEKEKGYHRQERRYGSFERSFGLPDSVDADRIQAKFNKGLLTVTLPKKAEAQKPAKTVAIKSD